MLNKLFSIKNEYKTNADNIYLSKHKVITILGVKIKIKHPLKPAKIFIHNEILFNSKRIYNLGNNKNIILNITGKGNIIKLNKILGAGKLIIELIDIDNSKLEIGQNNNINRTLTLVGHNTPSKRAVVFTLDIITFLMGIVQLHCQQVAINIQKSAITIFLLQTLI